MATEALTMSHEPIQASILCQEKRAGLVLRLVQEVEPSEAIAFYLRSSVEGLKMTSRPFMDEKALLRRGTRIFLVDNVGALIVGVSFRNHMPDVHIVFWDKVLRGREDLCRVMAALVADQLAVAGVWTAIPEIARATLAFADRIGFVEAERVMGAVVLDLLFT